MKFSCQRDTILKELPDSNDFTSQRNTVTMLANACIILSGNNLTIKTTDQKMGYVSDIAVNGIENGTVAVACDKFLEIMKNLPSQEINFSVEDDNLIIIPENSTIEFKLRTQDPSAFPNIDIPEEQEFFKIAQKDLTDMINQVSFAVSDDESKFAMNGALLERDESSVIMVGTDGRRLSYINRSITNSIPQFSNVTIPAKFLGIIKKHSVNEGDFEICVTAQSFYVKNGSCVIFSNLIKNEFPAYRRVIPQSQTKYCIVNIKALEDAIKRASLFVESKYKKIYLEFTDNNLIVSTEETNLGAGREVIPCKYNFEDQKCAMNYTYLLSPLKVMDGDEVKISFSESGRPFTITPEPERDYLHVVMPMNLS